MFSLLITHFSRLRFREDFLQDLHNNICDTKLMYLLFFGPTLETYDSYIRVKGFECLNV